MKLLSLSIGNTTINPPSSLPPPGTGMVEKILKNSLMTFLFAGIIISVLVIVWGGIMWITSGGDKQKLASAKTRITWAVVGLIIMLLSFLIINAFSTFFGVDLLKPSI